MSSIGANIISGIVFVTIFVDSAVLENSFDSIMSLWMFDVALTITVVEIGSEEKF